MVWVAGQKLGNNRYTIESHIGAGGLGITYLARSQNGDRVVIKTLKDDILNNPTLAAYRSKYLRDFWDEAGRLGMCRHPHIVEMGNAFYEGQLPCLVMEYVEGEDLGQRVQRLGILSEAEALGYIGEIGDALTEVHSKNLLHRDIKPSNIMIRALTGEAVLIDFGIAREFDPNFTQQHTQAFTNGFSPIEQYATGERRGKFSDVYSLAATLYYLLTAQLPIPATSRAAGIELIPPKDHNYHISDTVNLAILAGMEFEGQNRPQSVEEWLELLDAATVPTELEKTIEIQINPPPNPVPPPPNPLPSPPIQLISAQGVDYRKLRDLLADGKWAEADKETWKVMLQAAGREKEGFIRVRDINLFPSEDLCTIDGLWVHYSDGQFGFSVQKQIYESLGGTRDYDKKIWRDFATCVGWRVDDKWLRSDSIIFSINNTDIGHFPRLDWTIRNLNVKVIYGSFLDSLDNLFLFEILCLFIYLLFVNIFVSLYFLSVMILFHSFLYSFYRMILGRRCSLLLSRQDLCGVALTSIQQLSQINLISAVGSDYRQLQAFLATGHWEEANKETLTKMLEVAKRKRSRWLRRKDIEKFPYEDLHTIDQLWVHYSNGRFGFSVQKRIYQNLGGTRQYNKKIWEDFCDRLGWRVNNKPVKNSDLTFAINAPLGHLPKLILQEEIETKIRLSGLVLYLLLFLGLLIAAKLSIDTDIYADLVAKWLMMAWLILGLYLSFDKLLSFGLFWFFLMIFMVGMVSYKGFGFPIWVQAFGFFAWLLGNLALILWHLYDTIQLKQRHKQGQSISILLSRQSL